MNTIERLANSEPLLPERTAVLVGIPLRQETHTRQLRTNRWGRFWKSKLRPDFINGQPLFRKWDIYRKEVVAPALAVLGRIRAMQPAVVLRIDATYAEYRQALCSGQFDCVCLVTHHLLTPEAGIEFVDGGIPLAQFRTAHLEGTPPGLACLYFICQSNTLEGDRWMLKADAGSVGTADWDVPLLSGLRFLHFLLRELDGQRNLPEAYHRAVKELTKQI